MPFYQLVKEGERVIRFLFIGEAKRGMKGVEVDEKSVAVFFIVEYGESVINVPIENVMKMNENFLIFFFSFSIFSIIFFNEHYKEHFSIIKMKIDY